MGGELVSSTSKPFTEVFDEKFPFYLSLGMSAKDFWDGDCTLTKAYRKADTLRKKRDNYNAWLQGMYYYEALCDASPAINAFAKDGTPFPYVDRPYPTTDEEIEQRKQEKAREAAENFRMLAADMNRERGG